MQSVETGRRWVGRLFLLYIVFLPIKILDLPFFQKKIQFADLIFIFIFLAAIPRIKNIARLKLTLIDQAIIAWLFVQGISVVFHPTKSSGLELAGTAYLAIMYGIFSRFLLNKNIGSIRSFCSQSASASILFIGILGIAGILLTFVIGSNLLMRESPNYPFLGTVYRLNALSGDANMVASVLIIFSLLLLSDFVAGKDKGRRKWRTWSLLIALIIVMFTYSKSIILAGACVALGSSFLYFKRGRLWIRSAAMFLIGFFLFNTHFALINKSDISAGRYRDSVILAEKAIVRKGKYSLVKTTYGLLREKEAAVFRRNPLVGVGPGNFAGLEIKDDGDDYSPIEGLDPHSSYAGSLVEMGLIGVMAFLGILVAVFRTLARALKDAKVESERRYVLGLMVIATYMAFEAMVMDVMNFRHYWIIFALITALSGNFAKIIPRLDGKPISGPGRPSSKTSRPSAPSLEGGSDEKNSPASNIKIGI